MFTFIPESCSGHPGTLFGIIPESRSPLPGFPKLTAVVRTLPVSRSNSPNTIALPSGRLTGCGSSRRQPTGLCALGMLQTGRSLRREFISSRTAMARQLGVQWIIRAIESWRAALGLGVILGGWCRKRGLGCLSGCRRRLLGRCRWWRGEQFGKMVTGNEIPH